jgi:thiol:disulfide interchange protein
MSFFPKGKRIPHTLYVFLFSFFMKFLSFLGVLTFGILALSGCSPSSDSSQSASSHSANTSSKYISYSKEIFEKTEGKKILFFHADWCATCKAWKSMILQNEEELPKETKIFIADFDVETDVKQKYGVTMQSTTLFFENDVVVKEQSDPPLSEVISFFSQKASEKESHIARSNREEKPKQRNSISEQRQAVYEDYSLEKLTALKGNEPFILFFHADWCKTCRKWESNVMDNLDSLPQNTHILRVDYDAEVDLKKEYGVTMQSIAVFIDGEGGVVKKQGDPDLKVISDFFEA